MAWHALDITDVRLLHPAEFALQRVASFGQTNSSLGWASSAMRGYVIARELLCHATS
jgi:hypothetical protein